MLDIYIYMMSVRSPTFLEIKLIYNYTIQVDANLILKIFELKLKLTS